MKGKEATMSNSEEKECDTCGSATCAAQHRLTGETEEQFEELCEDWEADQAEMYG